MLISIDPKALEHACQCAGRSVHHFDRMGDDLPLRASIIAHARAIEQHEAFRQEVSDAVEHYLDQWQNSTPSRGLFQCQFSSFIIPNPDPLVEALLETFPRANGAEGMAADLRAAIEARGGRIVWEGE